jgi:starch synthase
MISNPSSLNILIITSEYPPELVGGLGTHVYELANGLGHFGCQVTVLAPSQFAKTMVVRPNVTVHFFNRSGDTHGAPSSAGMQRFSELNKTCVLYARQLIKKNGLRPDIIHCHDWLSFRAARELGRLFRIPLIGTVHLLQNPVAKWWGERLRVEVIEEERDLCCGADGLITVSHSMQKIIQAAHQVSNDRIFVVYNGMDARPFIRPQVTVEEKDRLRRVHAARDEKIIFFAGRLASQKGIQALLESASQVLERWPKARYLIAGTPDVSPEVWDAERITQQAKKMFSGIFKRWERLNFLGKVPRERLPAFYQIVDIAIIPSIYEPFGYAAIEAMAAGVPVVATEVGGLAEVIQDGQTGLLVPVQARTDGPHRVNIEKLSAAQVTLLNDGKLAKEMGWAGQRRVINEFSRDKMAQTTLHVYRSYAHPTNAAARN